MLEGWVRRHGEEWRFDALRALAGGARTRTQYELFCEWRNTFMRTVTLGEEGEWREALEHSGHDLPLVDGNEIGGSEALSVAISAENMRSAYRSFSLRGMRILPDRGVSLQGLSRVVLSDEGVLRFEEADAERGPSVVVNGVRHSAGEHIELQEGGGAAVFLGLFPLAAAVQIVEVDIAEVWARAWEAVALHLVWADQRHSVTRVRLRES